MLIAERTLYGISFVDWSDRAANLSNRLLLLPRIGEYAKVPVIGQRSITMTIG